MVGGIVMERCGIMGRRKAKKSRGRVVRKSNGKLRWKRRWKEKSQKGRRMIE